MKALNAEGIFWRLIVVYTGDSSSYCRFYLDGVEKVQYVPSLHKVLCFIPILTRKNSERSY